MRVILSTLTANTRILTLRIGVWNHQACIMSWDMDHPMTTLPLEI